jgi:electron transfer flavoprotein beta subunit
VKIVVLLRAVHGAPDSEEVLPGLAPCDQAALRTAIDLAAADSTVTALTVGPSADDLVLRQALHCGANRAVRLADPAVDGRDLLALGTVIAAAVQRLGFDLILAGHRSADWGTGAVGPVVAHLLAIPHVASVVALCSEETTIKVDQLREEEILSLSLPLPALLCVWAAPNRAFEQRPEIPAVESWSLADVQLGLNLDLAPRTASREGTSPASPRRTQQQPSARALLLQLKNSGLIR